MLWANPIYLLLKTLSDLLGIIPNTPLAGPFHAKAFFHARFFLIPPSCP